MKKTSPLLPATATTTKKPSLPKSLSKYFWDCRFEELSLEKNDLFIAARILNFGDWKAVTWLHKNGGRTLIRRAVKSRRDLSAKTINFWNLILHD